MRGRTDSWRPLLPSPIQHAVLRGLGDVSRARRRPRPPGRGTAHSGPDPALTNSSPGAASVPGPLFRSMGPGRLQNLERFRSHELVESRSDHASNDRKQGHRNKQCRITESAIGIFAEDFLKAVRLHADSEPGDASDHHPLFPMRLHRIRLTNDRTRGHRGRSIEQPDLQAMDTLR